MITYYHNGNKRDYANTQTQTIKGRFKMKSIKKFFKNLFGNFQAEATSLFLKQIHNPHIRNNVQLSESPRDAAIMVVQDALEIAGAGKVIGRITDIAIEKGMYIVKYELFGEEGAISYMPNRHRSFPL